MVVRWVYMSFRNVLLLFNELKIYGFNEVLMIN